MQFRVVVTCVALLAAAMLPESRASAQGFCFENAVNYAVGSDPQSVFAADLDGDGDQDLVVTNFSSDSVSVLKNNGDGGYGSAINYAAGVNPRSVFAADLDADGDQDLAVANQGNNNVSVLKNNGDGTFAAAVNYAAGSGPQSVFATDLDGDGDQDLAVADYSSDSVSVLKNNGDGTFAAAVNYAAGDGSFSVFAADLDGDNDADLAVANLIGNDVSVLKNSGDGTFAAVVNYAVGPYPASVFAVDLDGDGDRDLAVANSSGGGLGTVSVLKNNGNGAYAAAVTYAAGSWPQSVFVADLDGDGDRDLAVANGGSGGVSVLKNSGNGTFAESFNYAVGSNSLSVVAADMDGDGDKDLAVANESSNNVSVLKNCLLPIVVTTLNNSGVGSLRLAIEAANTHAGIDTITFSIAGTISLSSPLPAISDASGGTVILGFTAPGASAPNTPTVILDGSGLPPGPGILIQSSNNRIEGLTIRNVNGPGVAVTGATSAANTITGCRLYGNVGPGIDLGNDGVTPNDPGDADTGPNTLLNYPVFDSILETSPGRFSVYGRATPSCKVELFLAAQAGDPGHQPEGTTHGPAYMLLAWTVVAVGDGFFSFPLIILPEWSLVTATATDPAGNTSELALNKVLTPDPLRITGYSELVPPPRGVASSPLNSPALQVIVYSPPNSLGHIDSIGPSFNTFGSRATYDSAHDYNSGGLIDGRVTIVSPDTGEYRTKYILIGDPGNYLTGIGIDGHAEVKKQVAFAAMGQVVDTTYRLAPPIRGNLNGDGVIDVFDVIASIDMIFSGAPMPDPLDLLDVNCDQVPDIFDIIYLIDYVFSGGPVPCQ